MTSPPLARPILPAGARRGHRGACSHSARRPAKRVPLSQLSEGVHVRPSFTGRTSFRVVRGMLFGNATVGRQTLRVARGVVVRHLRGSASKDLAFFGATRDLSAA